MVQLVKEEQQDCLIKFVRPAKSGRKSKHKDKHHDSQRGPTFEHNLGKERIFTKLTSLLVAYFIMVICCCCCYCSYSFLIGQGDDDPSGLAVSEMGPNLSGPFAVKEDKGDEFELGLGQTQTRHRRQLEQSANSDNDQLEQLNLGALIKVMNDTPIQPAHRQKIYELIRGPQDSKTRRRIVFEDKIFLKWALKEIEGKMNVSYEGESKSDPAIHWMIMSNETTILVVRSASKYYYWTYGQTAGALIIFCMIVVGNLSILHRLKSCRRRRSNVNYFIVQLAIADLLVGIFSVTLDSLLRIQKVFNYGLLACRASKYIAVLFIYSSTNLLVALSIDRWEAVVKPLAFTRNRSRGYHLAAGSWILALICALPVIFITDIKIIDDLPQCWIDLDNFGWRLYLVYLTSLLLVVPTIIIAVCYTHIVYTIWSKARLVADQQRRMEEERARRSDKQLQLQQQPHRHPQHWQTETTTTTLTTSSTATRLSHNKLQPGPIKSASFKALGSSGRSYQWPHLVGSAQISFAQKKMNKKPSDKIEEEEEGSGADYDDELSRDTEEDDFVTSEDFDDDDDDDDDDNELEGERENRKNAAGLSSVSSSPSDLSWSSSKNRQENVTLGQVELATNVNGRHQSGAGQDERIAGSASGDGFEMAEQRKRGNKNQERGATTKTRYRKRRARGTFDRRRTLPGALETTGRERDQDYVTQQHGSGVIPKARIKTIKMTLVIVVAYILCWSPFCILNLCVVFGLIKNDTNVTHAVMTLTQSLAHLNSAVNPIIFWLFSSKRNQTNQVTSSGTTGIRSSGKRAQMTSSASRHPHPQQQQQLEQAKAQTKPISGAKNGPIWCFFGRILRPFSHEQH